MAYRTNGWLFFMLLLLGSLLSFPSPILSDDQDLDDEEQNLLDGLNAYRNTHNLPDLSEVSGATCLAGKIATQFQDSRSCFAVPSEGSYSVQTPSGDSIPGYYRLLGDCGLTVDSTRDGVVLPACVGDVSGDVTYAVSNFTETGYARYLRDSDYTGVGIGSEGDWTVVVLTTDGEGGDFSGGRRRGLVGGVWVVGMSCLVVWFMSN